MSQSGGRNKGVRDVRGILTSTVSAASHRANRLVFPVSQWPDPYFNGRVQDFRIYAGALSQSEIAALVEHGVTLPVPPAGLRASVQAEAQRIDLSWHSVTEAEDYSVWRAAEGDDDDYQLIAEGVTETDFGDRNVVSGVLYHYRVTSSNAAGESVPSAEVSVELPAVIGINDSRVSSIGVEGSAIVMTLPAVSGFQYQLQRRKDLVSGEWEDVGDPIPASGEEIELSDVKDPELDRVFYRVVIRPNS